MHRSTGMGIANAEQPTKPSVSTSLQQPPALMDLQIIPPLQLEFKEMVSQKCAERGIIFAPMPGRREATGKQVNILFFICIEKHFKIIFIFFRFIEWENYSVISIDLL